MRTVIVLLLAFTATRAEESLEAEFIAALEADLAKGKAEQTLKFIAPSLRQHLSAARLSPVYAQVQKAGAIASIKRDPKTPFARGQRVRFVLEQPKETSHVLVTFNADGKIVSYWFRPAPPKWTRKEILDRLGRWSGQWAYYRNVGGEGQGYEFELDAAPLGSIFKLYVLAELARQVEDGTVRLDQKVKIREEWKSLPSGVLQLKPAGTEVTVDELATKMISISDNTATDHLIHLLGRRNIERGLKEWGNSFPELNAPFLTTREMFLIKGGGKEVEAAGMNFPQLCKRWKAADRATRLEWVKKITAPYAKKKYAEIFLPVANGYALRSQFQRRHLTFEWFATAEDIADLLVAAWEKRIAGHETFLKYYATGSEIYPRDGLKYYGFKGGSETNVMAMSAMAVRPDGRVVAVCVCRRGDIGAAAGQEVSKMAAALLREGLER